MAGSIAWFIVAALVMGVAHGDPIGDRDRMDDESSEGAGAEGLPRGEGEGEGSSLAAATARLVEELARHGLGSASPFAQLLDAEAAVWGRASAAAWDSPWAREARAALAPCVQPDAHLPLCVRESMLKALGRAGRVGEVRLLGGALTVSGRLAGNPPDPALATEDQLQQLPEDPAAREQRLDDMIAARLTDLAASHVITLRATPEALEAAKGGVEEVRGKKGKYMPFFFMMALMMKGMLMALALGTIAMIAGKALTVGLMALVLSAVIGLKKLASQGGGYEVVNVSPSHHHARHLSPHAPFQLPEGVAPLLDPYRAHKPSAEDAPNATS